MLDIDSSDKCGSKEKTRHDVRYNIDDMEYQNSFIPEPDQCMEPYLNIKASLWKDYIDYIFSQLCNYQKNQTSS